MIDWHLDFDRDRAETVALANVGAGGLLVVLGRDVAGRTEAAAVLKHRLEQAGATVIRARETVQSASPMRAALHHLLSQLAGSVSSLNGVPLATLMSSASTARLARRIASTLRSMDSRPVLVVEEVDAGRALSDELLANLAHIADSGCLLIVTSRKEDRTDWRSLTDVTVFELLDFSVIEVRDHIDRRYVGPSGAAARDQAAQILTAAAPSGRIKPKDAYGIMAIIDQSFTP